MYPLTQIFIVLLLSTPGFPAQTSFILEINDKNFYKQTTIHPYVLLMFYGDKCVFCDNLQHEFEYASHILSSDSPKAVLARINCDGAGKHHCIKSGIKHLPTLKLYHDGHYVKDYLHSRQAWSLVKFVKAQINPGSHEIVSIEAFRRFLLEQRDTVYVGFFADESKTSRAFHKIAEQWKEMYVFAHSHCENLLRRQRVYDGVVLFRPIMYQSQYEEDRLLYEGEPIIGKIKTFITTNYHGLVGLRTPFNLIDFAYPLTVLYYTLTPEGRFQLPHYWRNRILKVAKKHPSMSFAVSHKEDFEEELEAFGIHPDHSVKPFVLAWSLEAKKFKMKEEFTTENLDQFVTDLLEGRLMPHLKSMPSRRSHEDVVIVAVGSNFHELVIDNDMDTMVLFYAPWCGYSQKFFPVYKEFAEMMKDEDVAVVKIDATANDVPSDFNITEIPTVFWLARYTKHELVKYKGAREVDGLVKFVAQRATNELNGYDRRGYKKLPNQKVEL